MLEPSRSASILILNASVPTSSTASNAVAMILSNEMAGRPGPRLSIARFGWLSHQRGLPGGAFDLLSRLIAKVYTE